MLKTPNLTNLIEIMKLLFKIMNNGYKMFRFFEKKIFGGCKSQIFLFEIGMLDTTRY